MKFIAKLKKAISPNISPTAEEIRHIKGYLEIDWIAELIQQHEEELLLKFSNYAGNAGRWIPNPDLHHIFDFLIADVTLKSKRFPVLQTALENVGISDDRIREVLFRLLLSEKIDKTADYLDQIVMVVCSRGAGYTTKELVLMVEAGCAAYKHALDTKLST